MAAINYAHSIKVEALRRLGEILKAGPKNRGAEGIGPIAVPKRDHNTPTLAEMGLDKKTSALAYTTPTYMAA